MKILILAVVPPRTTLAKPHLHTLRRGRARVYVYAVARGRDCRTGRGPRGTGRRNPELLVLPAMLLARDR